MIATLPRYVRHGQSLTHAELFSETVKAFKEAGLTRTELAERIGVSLASVSRALTPRADARYAAVQRRIIAALTPFDVSDEPTFEVRRRGEA